MLAEVAAVAAAGHGSLPIAAAVAKLVALSVSAYSGLPVMAAAGILDDAFQVADDGAVDVACAGGDTHVLTGSKVA